MLKNSRSALEHSSFIESTLAEMLEAGVARHSKERLVVVSPLGVVPKLDSQDKLRVLVNMRYVNQAIIMSKFKMETLSSLSELLKAHDFMVSFDLKSGFGTFPYPERLSSMWLSLGEGSSTVSVNYPLD